MTKQSSSQVSIYMYMCTLYMYKKHVNLHELLDRSSVFCSSQNSHQAGHHDSGPHSHSETESLAEEERKLCLTLTWYHEHTSYNFLRD